MKNENNELHHDFDGQEKLAELIESQLDHVVGGLASYSKYSAGGSAGHSK